MSESEKKALLVGLVNAIASGDKDEINRLKYDNLFYGSDLLDVVINYVFLSHIGIDFDFGHQTLKKGTKLYRVRSFKENTDFNDPSQWSFPPHMPENRANNSGEPALYLGSTENVCLLETHINKGEKYYLGEYEVVEDIVLGGFLDCEDRKKASWYLAGVILNAFLIAPARGDRNRELFEYLDGRYKGISRDDLQINGAHKVDLPIKFGVINKKEEFYKITNDLLEAIKYKYPDGIIYSSCFIPLATVGIVCSDHNVVLYREGMKKVRFIKSDLKICSLKFDGSDVIKVLINTKTNISS